MNTEVTPTPETPAPTSAPSEPAADDDFDAVGGSELFTELADDVEEVSAGESAPVSKPDTAPTPPPEPVKAAPVEAPAAPTPPPAAVAPVATPTPPTPMTEEELKAKFEKDRAAVMAKLIERYAVPEDLTPILIAEPEKALPRLLAQLHMTVAEETVRNLRAMLPQAVRHVNTVESAQTAAANQFFEEWPELKDERYGPTVARVLAGYRQANPQASREEVIREGGVASMIALRLPLPERVMTRDTAHKPEPAKSATFTPAPAGAVRGAPSKGPDNVFAILAQEDLESG